MERVSLRTITMDIQPQDIITKDNVSIKSMLCLFPRNVSR
jgi:regulator of protease activity HflC (stomatin/prohibitin superfamily)